MENIIDQLKSKGTLQTDLEVFEKVLVIGKEQGFIKKDATMPMILEIMGHGSSICNKVYEALDKQYKKEGSNALQHMDTYFGWCIYMGIGLICLRQKAEDIEETSEKIINERTIEYMDEYVSDIAGYEYGSERSDKLAEHERFISTLSFLTIPADNKEVIFPQLRYTAKAMLEYGCALQLCAPETDEIEEETDSQDDDIFCKDNCINKEQLDEAIIKYFKEEQELCDENMPLVLIDFIDPYQCEWISQEYIYEREIDGKLYEIFRCTTDFSCLPLFAGCKSFSFYMLMHLENPNDKTTQSYMNSERLYILID